MGSSLSVAELLGPFWADPAGSGILSDFDGTLAAIVDDPAAAVPLPGVVDVLAGLTRRYGLVGVVSGRPAAFLQAHLGGRGLFLSGLYGLELADGDGDGDVRVVPEAEPWRSVVEAAAAAAPAGLAVERKGLSVTAHFRTDPSHSAAAQAWAAEQAAATGLVVHPARMSYELRPPVELDKGTVVAEAVADCRQVCFLGDDRGDLSAFDALDRHPATAVKVAVESAESPDELLARADLVVDGPEGALTFLRALLEGPGGR